MVLPSELQLPSACSGVSVIGVVSVDPSTRVRIVRVQTALCSASARTCENESMTRATKSRRHHEAYKQHPQEARNNPQLLDILHGAALAVTRYCHLAKCDCYSGHCYTCHRVGSPRSAGPTQSRVQASVVPFGYGYAGPKTSIVGHHLLLQLHQPRGGGRDRLARYSTIEKTG